MPSSPGRGLAAPENPLRRRISQGNCCPRCRRRLEGGEQDAVAAPPGRRRTRVPERPNPLRRRSSLRYSEGLRKNRSIRGFRFLSFLIYVFVRRVLFPHWVFFSLLHALSGICKLYCQLYWVFAESVVPLMSLLSLWCPVESLARPTQCDCAVHRWPRSEGMCMGVDLFLFCYSK